DRRLDDVLPDRAGVLGHGAALDHGRGAVRPGRCRRARLVLLVLHGVTMRILLRGAAVVAMGGIEEVRHGVDLMIEDRTITAMGPALGSAPPPDRVIDAR